MSESPRQHGELYMSEKAFKFNVKEITHMMMEMTLLLFVAS